MSSLVVNQSSKVPAKKQIADFIEDGIRKNIFKVGQQLPTTRELVKQAGVSNNTVRQAMAELEMKGIIESIRGKGTFVSKRISLSEEEAGAIRCNVKRIAIYPAFSDSNSYRVESMEGFARECESLGILGTLMPGYLKKLSGSDIYDELTKANCQGFIWLWPIPEYFPKVLELQKMGFPVVITTRSHVPGDVVCVEGDWEDVGFTAGEYFINSNCKKVLLLTHIPQNTGEDKGIIHCEWPIGLRWGFTHAYETLLEPGRNMVEVEYLSKTEEENSPYILEIIKRIPHDTAIVFINTYQFYYFLEYLRREKQSAAQILSGRKYAVVSNEHFLKTIPELIDGLDFSVIVECVQTVVRCAVQLLVSIIERPLVSTSALVKMKFCQISDIVKR